jgi:hypothetical protein
MSDTFDELLAEARERLREQQEAGDANASLGDEMTPSPEKHFAGRWRGEGRMVTQDRGTVDVYLVWDRDGKPGFLYRHARLVQEVDAERPEVGDRVLVLRGETEEFEKDGEIRKVFPYALRREPCSDPLPEGAAVTDADIPF